jgi:hypothetical protein
MYAVWCTPQGNIELMPKKEVLDFKPAPRPEQVDDKRPKQMEDRKHRRGGCADFCLIARLRPDAIFGNDRSPRARCQAQTPLIVRFRLSRPVSSHAQALAVGATVAVKSLLVRISANESK